MRKMNTKYSVHDWQSEKNVNVLLKYYSIKNRHFYNIILELEPRRSLQK